jgi:3-dehydroquinate dehydratase-2
MKLSIINGPNLNLLGTREPEIYGNKSFDAYLEEIRKKYPAIAFHYFQSNVEGELITRIQQEDSNTDGIILNAGGYTHTSVALADCIASIKVPVVEVHISNLFNREEFRHSSLVARSCKGTVCGFGLEGYELAILYFAKG